MLSPDLKAIERAIYLYSCQGYGGEAAIWFNKDFRTKNRNKRVAELDEKPFVILLVI